VPSFSRVRTKVILVTVASLAALAGPRPLVAQPAARSAPRAPCRTCEISVTSVAQLGAAAGGFNSLPTGIVDAATEYLVIFGASRSQPPLAISKEGGASRELGRTGGGPGEHSGLVGATTGPADSIIVVDRGNARLSVYTSGLRYVRSIPAPRAFSIAWLESGAIVANAMIDAGGQRGQPFHTLDQQGVVAHSFGAAGDGDVGTPVDAFDRRVMAAAGGDELWAAHADGFYRLQRWSASGKLLATFDRSPAWFPRRTGARPALSKDTPPDPVLTAVWPAANDVIWTTTLVSDTQWARGLAERRIVSAEQRPGFTVRDPDAVYDTMIEALDGRTGRPIAERRIDRALAFSLGRGLFAAIRVREDDTSLIDVVRLDLR
jgi:hypothetical protein